jgi:hypothetical protein
MSEAADLRAAEVLEDVKRAFGDFVREARSVLRSAETAAQRASEWLDGETHRREHQLERAEAAEVRAERDLEACEGQADDDYTPDCNAEEGALAEARVEVREAAGSLHAARAWRKRVDAGVEVYLRRASRLKRLLDDEGALAERLTTRKIREVETYLALSSPRPSGGK